jgi:hypothetical protein
VRVETVPLLRLIGAMHAITVDCSGRDPGHVAMPNLVGGFGKVDPPGLVLAVLVEKANFHACRVRREQRKIDPAPSQVAPRGCGSPSLILGLSIFFSSPLRSDYT